MLSLVSASMLSNWCTKRNVKRRSQKWTNLRRSTTATPVPLSSHKIAQSNEGSAAQEHKTWENIDFHMSEGVAAFEKCWVRQVNTKQFLYRSTRMHQENPKLRWDKPHATTFNALFEIFKCFSIVAFSSVWLADEHVKYTQAKASFLTTMCSSRRNIHG